MVKDSMKEQLTKKYQTNSNFLLRDIGDEHVLIPIGEAGVLNNSVISLNDTSQFLWKQFLSPITIPEVVEKAKEVYDDPDNAMEQEVIEFVNAYLEVGLLEEKL